MNVKEIVRAKNVDLLVNSYNKEAEKINREGFINKDDKHVKNMKNKYESLIARFDTDKNTKNKTNGYNYNVELDSKQITGIKGLNNTLKIRSQQ